MPAKVPEAIPRPALAELPKLQPWQHQLVSEGVVPAGQNGHVSICVGPMEAGYHSAWPRPIVTFAPVCGPRSIIGCEAAPSLGQIQTGSLLFCAAATLTGVLAFKKPLWSIES